MSKTRARSGKPRTCANCGGNNQRRRITTYPVRLTEPAKLAGKEILVGSVAVYECQSCGHHMPMPAGQAKIDRSITQRVRSCERPGCYEVFITTSRSLRQKFCSEECRRAMNRVLERERRWREPRAGLRWQERRPNLADHLIVSLALPDTAGGAARMGLN